MKNSEVGEENLLNDERFSCAIKLFNSQEWYASHDLFEEIWHETNGLERVTIQGILQIAVAQVHLERGNFMGAKILFGEGLGRLKRSGLPDLGLDIKKLCMIVESRLGKLHQDLNPTFTSLPVISKKVGR